MCGTPAVTIDLSKGNLMKKVVILEASDDIEVLKAPSKHFDRTLASARSFVGLKNVKELRSPPLGWKGRGTGLVVASFEAPCVLDATGGKHAFELIQFGAEGLVSGVVLDVVNEGSIAGIASEVLCAVVEYNTKHIALHVRNSGRYF